MRRFRFLDWQVYRDARRLFVLLLAIVKKLPKEYRFEIGSQITRASFSVVLNIAEGIRETMLVDEQTFKEIEQIGESISDQLGGFKRKIRGDKS